MFHSRRRLRAHGFITITFPYRLRFAIRGRLLHHRCGVFHHMLRGPLFHHCGLNVLANRGRLAIVTIARRTALAVAGMTVAVAVAGMTVAIATTGLFATRLLVRIFLSLRATATTTTPATATFFASAFGPFVTGRPFARLTLLHCG